MVMLEMTIGRLYGAIRLIDRLINSQSEYFLSSSFRSIPSKIQLNYDPPKVGVIDVLLTSKGGSSTFLPKIRR